MAEEKDYGQLFFHEEQPESAFPFENHIAPKLRF